MFITIARLQTTHFFLNIFLKIVMPRNNAEATAGTKMPSSITAGSLLPEVNNVQFTQLLDVTSK